MTEGACATIMSTQQGNQRRAITFDRIDQVMPEVHHLVPAHETVGNWSLGAICKHLEDSFTGSIEGFDLRNHRIKRFFMKRKMLEVALTKGIPLNYTVDPNITPPPHVDLQAGVTGLAGAIERYMSYDGRLRAHPLFGRMPRETWDRVHCVHCAHHLSFAIPLES